MPLILALGYLNIFYYDINRIASLILFNSKLNYDLYPYIYYNSFLYFYIYQLSLLSKRTNSNSCFYCIYCISESFIDIFTIISYIFSFNFIDYSNLFSNVDTLTNNYFYLSETLAFYLSAIFTSTFSFSFSSSFSLSIEKFLSSTST